MTPIKCRADVIVPCIPCCISNGCSAMVQQECYLISYGYSNWQCLYHDVQLLTDHLNDVMCTLQRKIRYFDPRLKSPQNVAEFTPCSTFLPLSKNPLTYNEIFVDSISLHTIE